jgi:Glycosyltransferase family 87
VRVGLLAATLATLPPDSAGHGFGNDVRRFHDIASSQGRPYRDFDVEVPPVGLFVVSALDDETGVGLAIRLGVLMLTLDLLIAVIVVRTWGGDAGFRYWVIGTPLALFIYLRLDLLSVLLAVVAVALARGRRTSSAIALSAGIFTKVWPALLWPILLVDRAARAAWWTVALTVGGAVAWIAWGGSDGPIQVLTFRHASGWEFQSPIGFLVWQVGRQATRSEAGSARVGTAPLPLRIGLALLVAGIAAWAYWRSRDQPDLAEGHAATIAVAALLVFSPVGSHQYLAWLLPWVAVGGNARVRDWAVIAGVAASATALYAGRPVPGSYWIDVTLLGLRNVAYLVILVTASLELARASHPVSPVMVGEGDR